MLYGLLVTLLVFVCLLLILVILIQQGKGGIGLGSFGGSAQMLFGGSGGQDIFQKITWILGSIFMVGSLGLFLLGSKKYDYSGYFNRRPMPAKQAQMPVADQRQAQQVPVNAPAEQATENPVMPVEPVAPVAPVQQ